MCIAAPGKVIKIEGRRAIVQYGEEVRYAMIAGEKVKVGDYVLVQMGIIINILTKKEAIRARSAW